MTRPWAKSYSDSWCSAATLPSRSPYGKSGCWEIDLHSSNSVVVVSDEVDHIVYQRRLPNDALRIRAALAPHREELEGLVIEATYNW